MPGLWIFGGILLIVLVYYTVEAAMGIRRARRIPGSEPTSCPRCGGRDHRYVAGGSWDGLDRASGKPAHGIYGYGICRTCGSKWAQWDEAPPYVPAEEEWQRETIEPGQREPVNADEPGRAEDKSET